MQAINRRFGQWLGRWIAFSARRRYSIIVAMVLATLLALIYTASTISVDSDTRGMLAEELAWRQLDIAYEAKFPMSVDTILVVVEAATPDQAFDAASTLDRTLQRDKAHYEEVFYAAGLDYFQRNGLLFLSERELQDLADQLATIQPLLGRLVREQNLRGFFELLRKAVQAHRDGEAVEIDPLLARIGDVLSASRQGQDHYLSWQHLISNETTEKAVYREFLVVKPKIDYGSLLPGKSAMDAVRQSVEEAGLKQRYAADVRLTGSAALAYEELESVRKSAGLVTLLAFVAVAMILTVGLGSGRYVIATLVTLVSGLSITAAIATATVGELNLISVAFAVLYIGLGVDFAIHFCLRFDELNASHNGMEALRAAGMDVGRSLTLCAVTTAIGLYAFIPTDYRGIAELGWISGTGMFVSLGVTLTLLPALLAALRKGTPDRPRQWRHRWRDRFAQFPVRHPNCIVSAAIVLAVIALALIPRARFDANTLTLQAPALESVRTYRDLLSDGANSPWSGIVLVRDEESAKSLAARLQYLPTVQEVRGIWDFIPPNQAPKLGILDDIDFLAGPTLAIGADAAGRKGIGPAERRQAFDDWLAWLDGHPPQPAESTLARLHQELQGFNDLLESDPALAAERLAQLERRLLQNLPGRLRSMHNALNAGPVDRVDVPQALQGRWVSADGWYLLEVKPREDLNVRGAMREFVESAREVTADLIGPPVIQLEAGDAVVTAFKQAFALAFCAIALLLLLLLRSFADALLALAPIVLTALITVAATAVADMPFNFANIIALPLLLGIGVDNSIHLLHRQRTAPPADGLLLRTSASRAMVVSGLTTIFSIGSLAFSPHRGTASMGLLLSMGIGTSIICALVLLPALMHLTRGKTDFRGKSNAMR